MEAVLWLIERVYFILTHPVEGSSSEVRHHSIHTFAEEEMEVVRGAPPPPVTDNFWRTKLTLTNYISLEREFIEESDSF